MKILLCPLASHGFVYPLIGIAKTLQSRGHEAAFVTGPAFAQSLEEAGLHRIPRGSKDGESFEVAHWGRPFPVAMQLKHIEYALCKFPADILVTTQLAMGALFVGELRKLPVAVLGLATYLWPSWPLNHKPESEQERRLEWRYGDMIGFYHECRAAFGLSPVDANHPQTPLRGDLLMVQSIPELHVTEFELPPRVHLIGSCGWEPETVDNDLLAWIETGIAAAEPIVYAQPGRSFGSFSFWRALCEALKDKRVRVVADIQKEDSEIGEIPKNFYVGPHVPQGKVLPYCSGVVTTGHTTSVLGALTHGLPSLLLPHGSASDDIAEHCERAGVAICFYNHKEGVTVDFVEKAVNDLLVNRDLKERAKEMRAAFARAGGINRAADLIEQLAGEKNGLRFGAPLSPTIEAINDPVVRAAVNDEFDDGSKLRVDTTVVQTNIRPPDVGEFEMSPS